MPNEKHNVSPPVNHIFVDYENVRDIDPSIIGSKSVHITLLLGAQKTKLDATIVEKLMQNAATVKLIRLQASGKNALDFTLAYYLGRAVLADPCGYFHIVSKDKGYDPLVEHLRSKHIHVRRHDDYSALTFSAAAQSPVNTSPVIAPASKPPAKSRTTLTSLETLEAQMLEHLRKSTTKRPGTKTKLVSFVRTHLGKRLKEGDATNLVEMMGQAGHLVTDDKGKITYHLDGK